MSGEDSAPVDFLICSSSSSDSENFDQLTSPSSSFLGKGKCPMCWKRKKNFTCTQCLLNGEFYAVSSSSEDGNANSTMMTKRYHELKMNLLNLQCKRNDLLKRCALHTEPKERVSIIVDQIEKCKTAIHLRKELKKSIQIRILNAERESEMIRMQSSKKKMDWPLYRSRLNNMQAQYGHKVMKFQRLKAHVQNRQAHLKTGTKDRILQLKQQVFPIFELDKPSRSVTRSKEASLIDIDDEDETVNALMTATINSYATDDWASAGGSCYCIVAQNGPALPVSGDYSDFHKWMDRNQGMANVPEPQKNLARDIPAALTYATQFVNLIAYYLDLRLPHRLSYSAFTNGDMLGGKFSRKVAKLNANLIHLCASQGIHHSLLQPRRTMANLVLLFDPDCDLGRRGPFEVGSKLAKSMEDSIEKDLVIYEDDSYESDTDWNDSNFPSDWENVQKAAISDDYGLQQMTDQSYLQSSTAYQSDIFTRSRNASMTGGLVSSVASFFRGWSSRSNY